MVKYESEMYDYPSLEDYNHKFIKVYAVVFVVGILIAVGVAFYLMSQGIVISAYNGFSGINAQINEDYWFEENMLYTSDGWSFTITKVQDFEITGIILGLNTYSKTDVPYRPINMFSPIDLFVGIDEVMEDIDAYPYVITSYQDRYVYAKFIDDGDWNYFSTHSTNIHIIPHSQEAFNMLGNITVHDKITLEGSLCNFNGACGGQTYTWNTDTIVGNYKCEVMLVDSVNIL